MDLEGNVGGSTSESSRVQAVCDWFGPTNFMRMNDVGGRIDHDAPNSPESLLIGAPIQSNAYSVALANPITFVSADDPPFLIMHDTEDRTVIFQQSELLYDAMQPVYQKAGKEVTLYPFEGAGHGGPAFRWRCAATRAGVS